MNAIVSTFEVSKMSSFKFKIVRLSQSLNIKFIFVTFAVLNENEIEPSFTQPLNNDSMVVTLLVEIPERFADASFSQPLNIEDMLVISGVSNELKSMLVSAKQFWNIEANVVAFEVSKLLNKIVLTFVRPKNNLSQSAGATILS